jgi:uncharacterized membrane-anchored protein
MQQQALSKEQELFQELVGVGFGAFKRYADFGDKMDDLTPEDIALVVHVVGQNVVKYVTYKRHAKQGGRE